MSFTSLEFIFGFAVVFFLLYFLGRGRTYRNYLLFAGSIVFYAWGDPLYVGLLLASWVFNWAMGVKIEQQTERARSGWLALGVTANLAFLAIFKYSDFVIRVFNDALGSHIPAMKLPFPLGVSFYTFMALAYLIDVRRGRHPAERNPILFGSYLAAFPKVLMGPIARYETIGPQIDQRTETESDVAAGLRRFVIGLAKKVLIANNAAVVATTLSGYPASQIGAIGAWLMVLSYTIQIYFDFSGYTDMAIGAARMMGFRYPENFNYPYTAVSVSDFWRRWHMTLTSFFRDYVYIPLGGNRVTRGRWIRNVMVVWALTGLWHGANWNFLLWGTYFGAIMVLERLALSRILERTPRVVQRAYTMLVVMVGWVLFMSPDLATIGTRLAGLVGAAGAGTVSTLVLTRVLQPIYLVAIAAGILGSAPWWHGLRTRVEQGRSLAVLLDAGLVIMLVLSVIMIAANSFQPFLYAQF